MKTPDRGSMKTDSSRSRAKERPLQLGALGLDIVTGKGLSACGALSSLTVPVLSLSLSLIILADFFLCVVVLVCVLRFLFCIWCECKSDD